MEDDPSRVIVESDGFRKVMITIYPANPLKDIRAVTLADLAMDKHGRIIVGSYHNGRPVRRKLFDFSTGSAQRFLLFGTTGAGKSRALQVQLIAEKRNGFTTWLADLKGGQSVPEARGQVNWRVLTKEGAMLMLESTVQVITERTARYSKLGRSAFVWGQPDRPLHVWIDEANRLLDKGSEYRGPAAELRLLPVMSGTSGTANHPSTRHSSKLSTHRRSGLPRSTGADPALYSTPNPRLPLQPVRTPARGSCRSCPGVLPEPVRSCRGQLWIQSVLPVDPQGLAVGSAAGPAGRRTPSDHDEADGDGDAGGRPLRRARPGAAGGAAGDRGDVDDPGGRVARRRPAGERAARGLRAGPGAGGRHGVAVPRPHLHLTA